MTDHKVPNPLIPPEPKASLAAASAIGSIARILSKLSQVDQKKVISAISELK